MPFLKSLIQSEAQTVHLGFELIPTIPFLVRTDISIDKPTGRVSK